MNRYIIISLFLHFTLPVLGQKDSVWQKDLKEITVSDERLEIYNTGSRTEKPDSLLKHIFNSNTLASLLDATSGLVVRSYGPGILATSSFRGGNAQQTALTWNGISINSPVNGQSDLNLIPSFLFDNSSLLPGLAGSLQGSGTISGGINLANNKPKVKGMAIDFLQTIASFGNLNTGLKIIYSKNKWNTATKGYYSKAKNNYPFINYSESGSPKQYLANSHCETFSVLHETGYQSLKAGTIKISYWATFANRQIPPTLLMGNSKAKQFDNGHKVMLQWDKQFKTLSLKYRSLWQKDYLRYTDGDQDINSISRSEFFTNDAEIRFKILKRSTTSIGIVQTNTKANVTDFSNVNTTVLYNSQRVQTALWASHFQQFYSIRTDITASIRREMVDNKFLPFIPAFGFKTRLYKEISIFGQISRVYRIPTLNDLYWTPGGNPNLKPESGWASELSAEYHKNKGRVDFTTSVTGFSRLIANWIQWQPVDAQIWSPVNIGKVNSRGIEWRSHFKIVFTKKLYGKLGVNCDYTKSQNVDKSSPGYRKQLIYIPYLKSSAYVSLGYNHTVILIHGSWVGKRYVTSDNLDSIVGYRLLNIAISQSYKIKNAEGDLFLKINNLFNKAYQAIIWRPMPGINFELGINLKIK